MYQQPPQQPPYGQPPYQQPNTQYPPQWQPSPQYPQQPYQQPPPTYYPQQQYYQQMPPPMMPPPPPKKKNTVWVVIAVIVGLLLLCGLISHAAHTQSPTTDTTSTTSDVQPTDTPTPTPTLAYELASIDSGGTISAADPSVAQYQTLLDSLHNKTGDSEQMISDETVRGQQLLRDKGITITLLDLLKAMDKATSKSYHVRYAEALAAVITIMEANQQ